MGEYIRRYNPNRSAEWNYGGAKWRLSRSKIDLFIECPRCFYLDNKLGTKRPGMPSFNLNIAVDALFKKEFDAHRKSKTPHPIMKNNNIDAVPYAHENINEWRDNFVGIAYEHKPTGLTVSGAIDDVWKGSDGNLIVVDYKATSKEGTIASLSDSSWEEQYKRQIGVYQWLFEQNNFPVNPIGYFVYANASQDEEGFNDKLVFETTLVPCEGSRDWIETTLTEIADCLSAETVPEVGKNCEYCPYREACGKKLQAIHHLTKVKS
ncbi:MAG: PD-(D/E)XK nuclease family protein [Candidatus Paceibacterota bacterium]